MCLSSNHSDKKETKPAASGSVSAKLVLSPASKQVRQSTERAKTLWDTAPTLPNKPTMKEERPQIQEALGGLWELLDQEGLTDFATTHARLILASKVTLCIWATMTTAVFVWSPEEAFQQAGALERQVCTVAFILLLMSNVSRFLPLFYTGGIRGNNAQAKTLTNSGFLVTAFTVQFIAMVACGLMAFFPTPVFIDPITGTRVFGPVV